jgi:hypothetical protein
MLFVAAVLASATASANEPAWQEVVKDADGFAEVDTANIRIDENRLTASVRITTSSQGNEGRSSTTGSAIFLRVFDCGAEKSGVSSMTKFTGPRGSGDVIKTVEGLPVDQASLKDERPGTYGHKVLEFVCERAKHAQVKVVDAAEVLPTAATAPQTTSAVEPILLAPPGDKPKLEQAAPVVQACVGPDGKLVREPVIVQTSGFPEIDAAAIKIAKANRYSPGKESGVPIPESCIKFRVKFVVKPD